MSFLKTVGQIAVTIGVSKVVHDAYEGGKKRAKEWKAKRDERLAEEQEPAGRITQQEPVEKSA